MSKLTFRWSVGLPLAAILLTASAVYARQPDRQQTLPAFTSDQQLGKLIDRMKARAEQLHRKRLREGTAYPPPPPPPMMSAPSAGRPVADTSEPITNVQEQGVDEGGIVKKHGKHLVILRRGRLFAVDVSGDAPRLTDYVDAYPAGEIMVNSAWYDEMLVSKDYVVVIGFSDLRFGTEVNRFRINADGKLTFVDSRRFRSADYYSSRNYASRLIGDRLVFYQPLPMSLSTDWREALPGVKRWEGPVGPDRYNQGFTRLAAIDRIYMAKALLAARNLRTDTFHSVTSCDLTAPKFDCQATVVVGSSSRTFYVAPDAVYVWTGSGAEEGARASQSYLYRMPLDGSAPRAIGVRGGPIDQFSFREDRQAGVVNVLVRGSSGGDSMWWPEFGGGQLALVRLPISAFGDGSGAAARSDYRRLPGTAQRVQNRYVGRQLLYAGGFYGETKPQTLYVAPLDGGKLREVPLPHSVSRLDVIGADGVAIGVDGDRGLGFSAIALNPASGDAKLEDTFRFADASEGENRSQAFFYRPSSTDATSGTMALPVSRKLSGSVAKFLGSASAVVFLNRQSRKLSPAGELVADTSGAVDDACQASCVDWYGNARPIFLGGRVFALMGYELVEGRMQNGRISEVRRLNFSPSASPARR